MPSLVPFLPTIAAAIHDATGVWLTEQPFTPERVLAALKLAPEVRDPLLVDESGQVAMPRSQLRHPSSS